MPPKTDKLIASMGDGMRESLGASRPTLAPASSPPPPASMSTTERMRLTRNYDKARFYPMERIRRDPDNVRRCFPEDAHEKLVDSIRREGLLTPITLRWIESDQVWMIMTGERRYRAYLALGEKFIPGVEHDDPGSVVVKQIIENCIRTDLNPMDRAEAIDRLMKEKSYQANEAAARLSMSESQVSKTLSLFMLSDEDKDRVRRGEMTFVAAVAKVASIAKKKPTKRTTRFERKISTPDMAAKLTVTVDKPDADEHDLIELLQAFIEDALAKTARISDAA